MLHRSTEERKIAMRLKRTLSGITAAVLALSLFSVSASAVPVLDDHELPIIPVLPSDPTDGPDEPAAELPFELSAPENVSITWLNGNDSPNTCEIHYSQNDSMSEWSSRKAADHDAVMKELNEMGYDDVWITVQTDWSIDSQDDWHYNEYWDTEGYDEDYVSRVGEWAFLSCSYSDEISMSTWIFRNMGNIDDTEDHTWYGCHEGGNDYDGWKDVLKEDQYDILTDEDGSYAKIDFTEHTVYTRVRFLVTCRTLGDETQDILIGSEWSKTAAVGKDAAEVKPLEPGDIAAPVISDLKYTEEESSGSPVISFKLDVSEELSAQLSQVTGTSGAIRLITEAKLADKENWTELQGDFSIKAGDMQIGLHNLEEVEGRIEVDTPIQLRARYYCMQDGRDDFTSDWSEIISFGAPDHGGTVLLGDVNGDGTVNMRDYTTLQKHLNGWVVEYNAENSDLNGDGKITMKDYSALQRMLNGYSLNE